MMGSTERALITFKGSFVPRYVLYYQAEYRCHPERPKAQFCQRCHKIGHRKDVCTLPPSTELCQTCSEDLTKLPPGQDHDYYATCRNCKGSHSSTWAECPEKLKADAKVTEHAYRRRLATRETDNQSSPASQAQDNHRSRSQSRHRHPNTPVRIHHQQQNSKHNETRPTERQDASRSPAAQAPRHQTVSQPLSSSPPPQGLKPASTPITASASYRDALAPTVVTNATNQPPIPIHTTIQDLFLYIAATLMLSNGEMTP
ncbi:hypothetical protein HPB48_009893 [Haemaphysalis longicornis]|uniref:Uncharacterized protein n=1 Tax=Haemaphysalis longicornis TaxID=44386 RepID=A0A9J6GSG8_HAELO|nr:hypothetical protein HPB48_009893 [Haemaphysalis longicornis]